MDMGLLVLRRRREGGREGGRDVTGSVL